MKLADSYVGLREIKKITDEEKRARKEWRRNQNNKKDAAAQQPKRERKSRARFLPRKMIHIIRTAPRETLFASISQAKEANDPRLFRLIRRNILIQEACLLNIH